MTLSRNPTFITPTPWSIRLVRNINPTPSAIATVNPMSEGSFKLLVLDPIVVGAGVVVGVISPDVAPPLIGVGVAVADPAGFGVGVAVGLAVGLDPPLELVLVVNDLTSEVVTFPFASVLLTRY